MKKFLNLINTPQFFIAAVIACIIFVIAVPPKPVQAEESDYATKALHRMAKAEERQAKALETIAKELATIRRDK